MNQQPRTCVIVSRLKTRATVRQLALAACVLVPALSWAQGEPQGPEQIIVTGTRLPDPNLISTSPIQVVTSQDIAISGRNDAFDILQLLPQNLNNDLGQDLGNKTSGLTTAGGVATADLRGLGPNRTLVLVNGRRLGNGSPYTAISSPAPDLDQIPTRLIERVEVVTGGASAVYGSDAIAGVVNFITKRDFEGIEFDAQTGFNWHDNSNSVRARVAVRRRLRPSRAARIRTAEAATTVCSPAPTARTAAAISPCISATRTRRACGPTTVISVPASCSRTPMTTACRRAPPPWADRATRTIFGPGPARMARIRRPFSACCGNQFVPRGSADTTPPAVFNAQKDIYMQRQYKRTTAGMIGHYDLNDHVQPYVEFGFMNDKTHQEIAPSALFRQSNPLVAGGNYLINCSNPLLSAQQQNASVHGSRRLRPMQLSPARRLPKWRSAGATSKAASARPTTSTRTTAPWAACAAISATCGATTATRSITTCSSTTATTAT